MDNNNLTTPNRTQIEDIRQHHIGRLLLLAQRAFSASMLNKLRERRNDISGVGIAHTNLLANVDLEGTKITTLAERAGMTKQSVGELVKDLEARGYVERTADQHDRRAVLVRFTDAGLQLLRDSGEVKHEIEAHYSAQLGERSFEELKASLYRLIEMDE